MPKPHEIYETREEAVRRLGEAVIRHETKGDRVTAAVFRELLIEAQDRLFNTPRFVQVGDHDPEPLCVYPSQGRVAR